MIKGFLSSKSLPAVLIITILLIRVVTVFIIGGVPCMDHAYLYEAHTIINFPGRVSIYLAPFYGILLYGFFKICGSLLLASSVIYILFSTGVAWMAYLILKEIFDRRTGLIALLLMFFLPNLTVAVAGFANTSTVSLFFILASLYILI